MIPTLILDYNTLDDNYSLVNKKYERGLFLEVSLAQWANNFDFVQKIQFQNNLSSWFWHADWKSLK